MKALALLLLVTATTAHAEPRSSVATERAFVIAIPVFALSSRAIAAEVELPVSPRLSLGVAAGVRDPASGDFGGYAFAIGPVVRAWRRPTQRGLHGVLRVESNVVHLARPGRSLGTAVGLDPAIGIGYRFLVRERIALTPDLGFGADIDLGHRTIPTQRRWTVCYGLALGGRW